MKKNGFLNFFITYLLLLAVFGIVDGIWLGIISKNFYVREIGDLLRSDFLLIPGLIFYALHPFMIWFWGFYKNSSWKTTIFKSAIYGFGSYATYDLSNWATLKNWSQTVVFVDIIWGTVASALVAGIVWFLINKKMMGSSEIKS
jgi:uncharacterized membrane protein